MTGRTKAAGRRAAAAALLAALFAAAALVRPGASRGEERRPAGKLEVTVSVEGEKPFRSCTLYLRDRAVKLEKGQTTFLFEDVAPGRYALTGDATVKTGLLWGTKRLVGVQEAAVAAGGTAKVTLALADRGSMEDYCRSCHPESGEPAEAGQIIRDLHASGKVLEGKYLSRVELYNDRNEKMKKAGQTYNLPIILEKKEVVEGGRTVERQYFTCESCHALHYRHNETDYARGPFRKKPDLCLGCHS